MVVVAIVVAVSGRRKSVCWARRRDLCHSNKGQREAKKAESSTKLASGRPKNRSGERDGRGEYRVGISACPGRCGGCCGVNSVEKARRQQNF